MPVFSTGGIDLIKPSATSVDRLLIVLLCPWPLLYGVTPDAYVGTYCRLYYHLSFHAYSVSLSAIPSPFPACSYCFPIHEPTSGPILVHSSVSFMVTMAAGNACCQVAVIARVVNKVVCWASLIVSRTRSVDFVYHLWLG